uniref:Ig-like domain-containing protein n=1 Tax=Chelydra serpentina TaxID=8475 RepID=A0A8C3T0D5_CHESE
GWGCRRPPLTPHSNPTLTGGASVLGSCLQPAPAQAPVTIVLTTPSPVVGGGVSLAPEPATQDFTSCSWYRSAITDDNSRILTYYPGPSPVQQNGPTHTGRETAGPGCALHIAGLTLSDTGNYTDLKGGTNMAGVENGTFTLTCISSPSTDTALWLWDGSYLALSEWVELSAGNQPLMVLNFTVANASPYQCEVRTPISTSLSEPRTHGNAVSLPCTEMLPRPTVTPNQTQVPENGTFTLTCNTSPSADTVLWLRDGASLVPSERLVLSPDNRTLTVLNVTRGDAGTYRCEVRNLVSTNHSEPSNVTVAYGPDSTRIDPPGPIDLTLGSPLTLTCVADSVPALSYRWVVNGTDTNETGSSLTFNPTTLDHQGTYECQAQNPITNRTAWASVTVRFVGESPGSNLALPPCPAQENALLGARCRWGWGSGPCMEPGWGLVAWPGHGLTVVLGEPLGDGVSVYGPSSVGPGAGGPGLGLGWGVRLPHIWGGLHCAWGAGDLSLHRPAPWSPESLQHQTVIGLRPPCTQCWAWGALAPLGSPKPPPLLPRRLGSTRRPPSS